MAAVSQLETSAHQTSKTFDLDFAMNVLACSLPFSVILILVIYASGDFFASTSVLFISAALLLALAVLIIALSTQWVQSYRTNAAMENQQEKI
jgi:formate/nitrite transporter FocA (FNT family)